MSPDAVAAVVAEAARLGAALSFKDSLIPPAGLRRLASLVAGQVRWSACTKLHLMLTPDTMRELAAGGCNTLEIGLETLSPDGQTLIHKPQSPELFLRFLDAAEAAGIAVVVNYITGLPRIDAAEEEHWHAFARHELRKRPGLVAKIEHNGFQLERLAPMGRDPAKFGLKIVQSWPWATVLDYEILPALGSKAAPCSP